LGEVASIHRFSWWKRFRTVEVSASVIGLVWNSMMSMAGGWFFLTVNEAFTLGDRDFRLPGVGSYMAVAIEKGDRAAMAWAVLAMTVMIVSVDQLLWRPLVAWSQRFRAAEVSGEPEARSWVLNLVRRSALLRRMRLRRRRRPRAPALPLPPQPEPVPEGGSSGERLRAALLVVAGVAAAGAALVGVWKLVQLLAVVRVHDWIVIAAALGATFVRALGALALAVAWTLPVGILVGRSPAWSRRLQPVVQIVASFPAPMLFPLVTGGLLLLHVPFSVIAAVLMLLGAQWYVLFNVLAGASAVPPDLVEATDVYRVSGRARWRTLFLPAVFPFLVTGLITAAGGAWNASIVAETLVTGGRTLETFGLGSLITKATREANFPLLAAGVLTMSLALVLINRTVWRRLSRLAETKYALNR
jgi:NitT/TauT family transport system permease protein